MLHQVGNNRLLRFGLIIIFACMWSSCALSPSPSTSEQSSKDDLFSKARRAFESRRYPEAASLAWLFIKDSEATAPNYENAKFIIARSLGTLGFTAGAVEYYFEVIRHGASRELVVESMRSIVDVLEKHPYDIPLVEIDLIAASEYEFFPKEVDAYIRYIQGKVAYHRGDKDWAQRSFTLIEEETLPRYKVQYTTGVMELKDGKPDQAISIFMDVAQKAPQSNIRNLAYQTVGRMLYEEKKYKEALAAYEQIDSSVVTWDEVFLEKAWNMFHLEDFQRVLGYLHALSAPVFAKDLTPEMYLLKGMTLRRLCRFQDARQTIAEFRELYGSVVEHIRDNQPLTKSRVLSDVAKQKSIIENQVKFFESVQQELKRIQSFKAGAWAKSGLQAHLHKLYELKVKELRVEVKSKREDALKAASEEVLYYNEQMNLLEYETRMDEFRRGGLVAVNDLLDVGPGKLLDAKTIHWPFDQEFWIDELDHYVVRVESQCQ